MTAYSSPDVVDGVLQLGGKSRRRQTVDMRDAEPMVRSAYQAMRLH